MTFGPLVNIVKKWRFGLFGHCRLPPWVSEKHSRSNKMPLPNLNRRCSARARSTGNQCLNPAAFGCKTCRYHGARRRETIKVGKAHPQYKHGERTKEAISKYRASMLQLQTIETLAYSSGVLIGPRTGGRKQNINEKLS